MNSPYSPYGFDGGMGTVRRQPYVFSSKRANGTPMYQGPQFLIWMQMFPGSWILVSVDDEAA